MISNFLAKRLVVIIVLFLCGRLGAVQEWEFDSEGSLKLWVPNAHLSDVHIVGGVLKAKTIGADPFFLCREMSIEAWPWQYVVIKMRANEGGIGELFWSGELEGKYGGLTEAKKMRFSVRGGGQWQEVVLFPFWHPEGTIRQLRLDLYDGGEFEIDWIRIEQWGKGQPQSGIFSWGFGGDMSEWRVHAEASEFFAPPLKLGVSDKTWVTVQMSSEKDAVAGILWACEGKAGLQSEEFVVHGDGKAHSYNIQMGGIPTWSDHIVAFGIRLPDESKARIEQIRIGDEPFGPGELEVSYFGFENGVNRSGRPCKVLAHIVNRGGRVQGIRTVQLTAPKGLKIVTEPEKLSHEGIEYGDAVSFVWEIEAEEAGEYLVYLTFSGKGMIPPDQKAVLQFMNALKVSKAKYVPEPKPVKTSAEICAYYFPGWDSDGKWDCIGRIAPNRKPLLGYYDESNPECVDWQIKWAVENGISCFLVDWYWVAGHQHLTHWFEAYRKAKYRDFLKVAIMWANHNPPNTHSVEDWLKVTEHWIERYFSLDSYYEIDGKPAVFIWDARNIRNDLGGSEVVQKTFNQSQEMAKAAGYKGIEFVAMGYNFSESHINDLKKEGYNGVTTYHEWGSTVDGGVSRKLYSYEDVVRESPVAWQRKNEAAGPLCYYPVVDTGWDSRPWHGNKSMVIEGRTPELFEKLLRQAKSFYEENGKRTIILGPVNEWGEGSYIEPCTEFGFEMLEAIRKVFAKGSPSEWQVNISPMDVGLGPYDYPVQPVVTDWTFDEGTQGWQAMMNVDDFRCEGGQLQFSTTTGDAALIVNLNNVKASSFGKAVIRIKLAGKVRGNTMAQLFWSQGGAAISEASSVRFSVPIDSKMHACEINLAENPRWRGRITSLRLDPSSLSDIEVAIDRFGLSE